MVRDSLLAAGLDEKEFVVVPFSIQQPNLLRHYTPVGTVYFVRVYSIGSERRYEGWRAHGYAVVILGPDKATTELGHGGAGADPL